MSNLVKTTNKVNLNSKKARQNALQQKIEEIDKELKEIGVSDMKYRVGVSITNPETSQNTINISGITDISFLLRLMAYFQNLQNTKKEYEKLNKLPDTFQFKNTNGYLISDILHDINLRILTLVNQDRINVLTQAKQKLLPFMNEESRFINALFEVDNLFKNLNK